MKIQLHILQNFAPSNLNRDDTGSPKDCELGGVRRGRISSQCLKRAMRDAFVDHDLVPEADRAARTKRLVDAIVTVVTARAGVDEISARRATTRALEAAGLKADPEKGDKTQYLLFVPRRCIDALAQVVVDHFGQLGAEPDSAGESDADKKGKGKSKAKAKSEAKGAADPEVRKRVEAILADASATPELALFGRMIADAPDWNVDAACQVAHAVSTNRVAMEFDFYTAIDDLKKDDTAGSDMMGTIAFNSSCFYRYLVVDVDALERNLGGGDGAREQARRTAEAFLRAAVLAIPSGKQNSMAAHNPPSLVLVEIGAGSPRSLTNAFVEPVRAGREGDVVTQSVVRLGSYASALDRVYGAEHRAGMSYCIVDPSGGELGERLAKALPAAVPLDSFAALVRTTVEQAFGARA